MSGQYFFYLHFPQINTELSTKTSVGYQGYGEEKGRVPDIRMSLFAVENHLIPQSRCVVAAAVVIPCGQEAVQHI